MQTETTQLLQNYNINQNDNNQNKIEPTLLFNRWLSSAIFIQSHQIISFNYTFSL